MAHRALGGSRNKDDFARCHRMFVEHFGIAVLVVWIASAVAAFQAPWLTNIRGLIDPAGRSESTASYLFALPAIMALAWVSVACGADLLRRSQIARSHRIEFGVAGAVAFGVFCLAIQRLVTAVLLTA